MRERALRDERSLLREAREDGRAEGLAEGERQGQAEGERRGKAEGRKEGRDAALAETALNLIRTTALDDATIATVTGLPTATVATLRQRAGTPESRAD